MKNFFEFYQLLKGVSFFEGKAEKALAERVTGDIRVVRQLSSMIPVSNKSDKILVLASYFYSLNPQLEEIKSQLSSYLNLLKNNKMKVYEVDMKTGAPSISYSAWRRLIEAHLAEEARISSSKLSSESEDFHDEPPLMTSKNGKIRVYLANSLQQCISLGRGEKFCISSPGNTTWQSFRDTRTSTFYFVYDASRQDDLSIVVIDINQNKILLTDRKNITGQFLNPVTGRRTTDSKPYFDYLKRSGIDTSRLVMMPKSPEEIEEQKILKKTNSSLEWFVSLSPSFQSKYIGRGHLLSDSQFDWLWENRLHTLLKQYVQTGLGLTDHQVRLIAGNSDLKSKYTYNRMKNLKNQLNFSQTEWEIFSADQRSILIEKYKNFPEFYIRSGDFAGFKKKFKKSNLDMGLLAINAINAGNLEILKFLLAESPERPIGLWDSAIKAQRTAMIDYLISIKYPMDHFDLFVAAKNNFDIFKKMWEADEDRSEVEVYYLLMNLVEFGDLDIIQWVLSRSDLGPKVLSEAAVISAWHNNLEVLKYLYALGGKIDTRDQDFPLLLNVAEIDTVRWIFEHEKSISQELFRYFLDSAKKRFKTGVYEFLLQEFKRRFGA